MIFYRSVALVDWLPLARKQDLDGYRRGFNLRETGQGKWICSKHMERIFFFTKTTEKIKKNEAHIAWQYHTGLFPIVLKFHLEI